MDKINFKSFSKEQKTSFYQSKYNYYKAFNTRMIVVSTLAYFSFFVTDCGIYKHFAWETLLPRAIVIVPFIIYIVLSIKVTDYRIMVPASYLMVHIIIWCTDWATYILPDRQHAIFRAAVESSDNGVCKSTISIGVSEYIGGDYSVSVKQADDALY